MSRKKYVPPQIVSVPIAVVEDMFAPFYREAAERWVRETKEFRDRYQESKEAKR